MSLNRIALITLTTLTTVLSSFILTVSSIHAQQSSGRKPHPLLSGMSGYKIDEDTQIADFSTFTKGSLGQFICANKKPCDDTVPGFRSGKFIAEGKVTKVVYRNDPNPAGGLAIFRNYENSIKELGGRLLTSPENDPMGTHLFFVEKNSSRVWVILDNSSNFYILTFLEEKAMQQSVTAGKLAEDIGKQGFATLYINFDNNKAEIKAEAKPAIGEVVLLLKKDSALRLSIEGHTDNVGVASANKSLSDLRAKSVMKALVESGIDAKRLMAKGIGSEAPIADNRTEEGRAKNRRVELVRLK
jgi:OmpA-OmpF porin, OOP family